MQTYLEEIANRILEEHQDISKLCIILPSKRAGGFLRNYLLQCITKATFAPKIISIETFIEELSDLSITDPTTLLFESYKVYKQVNPSQKKDSFENYSSWFTTLLNDFNEIDRYLVKPEQFFSYLSGIKNLEEWNNANGKKSALIKNYLDFWDSLLDFYTALKHKLIENKIGYQGLVYRVASENIEHYIHSKKNTPHIFVGFNALNKAEQVIIQELLESGATKIYWDLDKKLFEDTKHSASYFIRNYLQQWPYYKHKNHPIKWDISFSKPKEFTFIEAQKNIAQVKYVSEILSEFSAVKLNNTAIVLADENLLIPMLYSLPDNVSEINVTMGVALKKFNSTAFFEQLISVEYTPSKLYYKEVITLLKNPIATLLIQDASQIINHIVTNNVTHFSVEYLCRAANKVSSSVLKKLFFDTSVSLNNRLSIYKELIITLRKKVTSNLDKTVLEQLYQVFETLTNHFNNYPKLQTNKVFVQLFKEAVASQTLDYRGTPYKGLQIMGVLETRVLDFETVIMTSVNEGVLPAGKSNASFITYDLKKEFKLPLYTEKDAVYTYHFYRLLQRAKDVYLLYNNYSEGIQTGEKSRFLLQLEVEKLPNHSIKKVIIAPSVSITESPLETITKTEGVLNKLKEIANKGFSPSSLTSYIRNPIDFYFEKVLGIKEDDAVEEIVAANTLGTVVHESIEQLYRPLIGKSLTESLLKEILTRVDTVVSEKFKTFFKDGTISKGKNLLIFEVAKKYIINLITNEIKDISEGNTIIIQSLEKEMTIPFAIPELLFDINLKGTVDRVDSYNGQLRIIDYKTSNVQQSDLEIIDWECLTEDYKFSKAFQVLVYCVLMEASNPTTVFEAGIISFKNLSNGFLPFATKPAPRSREKDRAITPEVLETFKEIIRQLISEICNPDIPFTEKEIL